MDKVHMPSDSECYTPSSEHFRFYMYSLAGFKAFTSVVFEEYPLLRYNAVLFIESQPTIQRNISPPSSELNKPKKIPT
jgi:hypothetical protein